MLPIIPSKKRIVFEGLFIFFEGLFFKKYYLISAFDEATNYWKKS